MLTGALIGLIATEATSRNGPVLRSSAVRVIDGDTFDFAGERIRILDIDTPETRPARCAREAELGARATERLRQLLGQPFELQANGRDEDRYGRKLRVVLVRGRSVGEQLVAEGLARRYEGGRRPWCGSAAVG